MRIVRTIWLTLLLAAPTAWAQAPAPLDTLFLANGERRAGRIVAVDAQGFSFSVPLVAGQPPATIKIPRASVQQIEFAPDEARDALLARAAPTQLAAIAALWARWEPFLAVPRSPAARVGLRYAELLLENEQAPEALALFQTIAKTAWQEEDRAAARPGRLRALVAAGRADEALEEARAIAAQPTAEPGLRIEAQFILAQVADRQFRQLIADNPRWEEDDRVRPERHRLFHDAVDLYLYPSLFHGSRSEPAARALDQLVALYRFAAEPQLALETARDIVALYPGTAPAKSAAAWIAALPARERAEDWEKQARRATTESTSASQKP